MPGTTCLPGPGNSISPDSFLYTAASHASTHAFTTGPRDPLILNPGHRPHTALYLVRNTALRL